MNTERTQRISNQNYNNDSLPKEDRSLVTSNNRSQVFNQISDTFNQIYQLAPKMTKDLSSYDFSLLVKESEICLSQAEEMLKDTPEIKDQVDKMREQFNLLVRMSPFGPSVLLKRDINNIKKLSEIPTEEKYSTEWGDFYEPKVSVMEMVTHFQDFCKQNNYLGTAVALKRTDFYGSYENKMMTLVGFKQKEIIFPRINSFIKQFNLQAKEDVNELKNSLEKLAAKKIKDWRYERFEIIFTENTQGYTRQKIEDENKYRCFIIFFHKKFENEEKKLDEK